jgi:Flp pilus assembly pilin Flp
MKRLFFRIRTNERGASLVEYGLLVVAILIVGASDGAHTLLHLVGR